MAPRFLTTKTQISGYRMLVRRIEQAFIRRDVRLLSSPFSAQTAAYSVGAGLGALVLLAGLVMSFIKPAPLRGDATIIATQSGGRYVMHNGALHPVTNLSSARLIVGKADAIKTVKDSEVSNYPRGLLMGIAGAPEEMIARGDDTSRWEVCSQYDAASKLDLTPQTSTRTLVVAGGEESRPAKARSVTRKRFWSRRPTAARPERGCCTTAFEPRSLHRRRRCSRLCRSIRRC
ncbi:type VII secretion protein EccB [Rhodococcus hoagii]|nr:type VII secretion protein EccB [Prescottella equi]